MRYHAPMAPRRSKRGGGVTLKVVRPYKGTTSTKLTGTKGPKGGSAGGARKKRARKVRKTGCC